MTSLRAPRFKIFYRKGRKDPREFAKTTQTGSSSGVERGKSGAAQSTILRRALY